MKSSAQKDYLSISLEDVQEIDHQTRIKYSSHGVGMALNKHFQRMADRAFKKGEQHVVDLIKGWAYESFEGSRPIHRCWALFAITLSGFWDEFLTTVEQCLIAGDESRKGVAYLLTESQEWYNYDKKETGKISLGLEPVEKEECLAILFGDRPWIPLKDANEIVTSTLQRRVSAIKAEIGGGWQS